MKIDRPEICELGLAQQSHILRCALELDQLILHYQPYIDLCTHKVVGVEALLRLQHPVHGMLPPQMFIPAAERSGLIGAIGEWVILKACTQMKEWQTSGIKLPSLSVNISPLQFDQSALPNYIQAVLNKLSLAADLIDIEITESSIPTDPNGMYRDVSALRKLGVKISIDDFGLGYSSFERLKMMQVDRIKIDRLFVSNLTSNYIDRCLVNAMIDLSIQLGVSTVAEGIEQLDTLDLLRSMGCEQGQGFYISPPLSTADCERYLLRSC